MVRYGMSDRFEFSGLQLGMIHNDLCAVVNLAGEVRQAISDEELIENLKGVEDYVNSVWELIVNVIEDTKGGSDE